MENQENLTRSKRIAFCKSMTCSALVHMYYHMLFGLEHNPNQRFEKFEIDFLTKQLEIAKIPAKFTSDGKLEYDEAYINTFSFIE